MKIFISLKHATKPLGELVAMLPDDSIAIFYNSMPVLRLGDKGSFYNESGKHTGDYSIAKENWDGKWFILLPPGTVTSFIQE